MAAIVHLGSDDGLLEAASRLASSPGEDDVVLAVPESAPVLSSPVFLQTLRDLAAPRHVVLVTADLRARAIASGVRVPAYASLAAFEQRSVDATEELEKRRLEAIAQIGRERRKRRAVRRRTLLAVALAVAVMLAFVPSAELTVAGEEAAIGPVELDVNATVSGTLQAQIFSARLSASAGGTSSGSRSDRVKATGAARFSNVSTDRLDVAAGTLVWTTANVMFRTTQTKSIAPSTFFPFLVNEAQIPIEAVEPGIAGNVARGEIRNVADKRLRVNNDQATSGGDEKKIALVATPDYTAASAKLDQNLDAALRQQLDAWKAELPSDMRLEDHYTTKTLSRTQSGDVIGKEIANFTLSASMDVTAYGVPGAEPRATAVRELVRQLPPEHELVAESIQIDIPSVRFTTDGLTWHVLASARHRPRLDEGALQLALAGQDRSSAAKLLEPRGMKLVELHAFPTWWPRLPLLPLRIGVRSAAGS